MCRLLTRPCLPLSYATDKQWTAFNWLTFLICRLNSWTAKSTSDLVVGNKPQFSWLDAKESAAESILPVTNLHSYKCLQTTPKVSGDQHGVIFFFTPYVTAFFHIIPWLPKFLNHINHPSSSPSLGLPVIIVNLIKINYWGLARLFAGDEP